jgi:hypothetical protein
LFDRLGPRGVGLDFRGDRKAFDDLLVWLDAITMGVQLCAVGFVSLTGYRALEALRAGDDLVQLRVKDSIDSAGTPAADVLWEVLLPRRELVATFYAALREFAAEPANEPRGDVRRERIEQWLAAG